MPEREERQDAEHEPSQDAEQDVVPEIPSPAAVQETTIITRLKTGTKISSPGRKITLGEGGGGYA